MAHLLASDAVKLPNQSASQTWYLNDEWVEPQDANQKQNTPGKQLGRGLKVKYQTGILSSH